MKETYTSKIYTIKEVSKILKCNVNRVHELRKSGLLKCLKIGSWKVTESSLDDFIRKYDGQDIDSLEGERKV